MIKDHEEFLQFKSKQSPGSEKSRDNNSISDSASMKSDTSSVISKSKSSMMEVSESLKITTSLTYMLASLQPSSSNEDWKDKFTRCDKKLQEVRL